MPPTYHVFFLVPLLLRDSLEVREERLEWHKVRLVAQQRKIVLVHGLVVLVRTVNTVAGTYLRVDISKGTSALVHVRGARRVLKFWLRVLPVGRHVYLGLRARRAAHSEHTRLEIVCWINVGTFCSSGEHELPFSGQ